MCFLMLYLAMSFLVLFSFGFTSLVIVSVYQGVRPENVYNELQ